PDRAANQRTRSHGTGSGHRPTAGRRWPVAGRGRSRRLAPCQLEVLPLTNQTYVRPVRVLARLTLVLGVAASIAANVLHAATTSSARASPPGHRWRCC